MPTHSDQGVALPEGHTGSTLFHGVLQDAVTRFPEALQSAGLPRDAATFKRDYREALVRFEACRTASPRRVEIARMLVQETQAALRFVSDRGVCGLGEHLLETRVEPDLREEVLPGAAGLRLEVPFEGKLYRDREVAAVIERLEAESGLSDAAANALRWMLDYFAQHDGRVCLSGHSFALLGAGAELAPSRMLLRAGARVLWIDVARHQHVLGQDLAELGGSLWLAPGANDLLSSPAAVVAAIERFAADDSVHLGLFAYASGASREWRLAATMNAIATRLDPARLRSVSMLVSPTTAAPVQPETARQADARARRPVLWERALRSLGLLSGRGYLELGGARIARAAVSIQGLSYQAAQYVSKLAAAETFAVHGTDLRAPTSSGTTVSANVAGITRTRSLQHPLFQAAFIGAPRFGVRIFDPATTRALSGLMILHDLLNPEAPGAASVQFPDARQKAERLLSQQVHGGIYAMPYALEPAIRMAALLGLGQRPGLLLRSRNGRTPTQPASPAVIDADATGY